MVEEQSIKTSRSSTLLPKLSILLALFFFTVTNILYAENKPDFETTSGSSFYPDLTLILLLFGAGLVTLSAASFLLDEHQKGTMVDEKSRVSKSVGSVIAEAISENGRIIALVGALYGLVFALLDGILIYQPTVDFAKVYGFANPAFVTETCCGPPGYIPVGLVYLPTFHLGIQLIPISVLIMIMVSSLVGLNVGLLIVSVRVSRPRNLSSRGQVSVVKGSYLGSTLGAAFGVFAGCPTCAAAFFLSMLAGSGATAFSLTISEFQPAIVLISIPLLLGSILWQARSVRNILLGCSV